jgi:hypothetical protein
MVKVLKDLKNSQKMGMKRIFIKTKNRSLRNEEMDKPSGRLEGQVTYVSDESARRWRWRGGVDLSRQPAGKERFFAPYEC